MTFEFEALVGHLYVVGGRSISAPPPGALVEVAPQKAARGRETDTFFSLVLPSGDALAPTDFYSRMAKVAAERYFESTGSVTSGLRNVFNSLNQDLVDHNQRSKQSYEANIICAVLRGHDLITGRVGSGAALVQHDGKTQSFPEDLNDDEALYTPPLGINPLPNIKMSQFNVGNGTRVVFGDSNLADLDRKKMDNALKSVDIGMVLVGFKELARLQLSMMAVEFVPPDAPVPPTIPEGESTAEAASKLRATPEKKSTEETPASSEKAARPRRQSALRGWIAGFLGAVALRMARILGLFNRILDHFFGPAEEGERRWLTSSVGAGMAILVPVAAVALVILLWLSNAGTSGFELCVQEAENRAELARSVANSERQTVINAWTVTLAKIDECNTMHSGDPGLQQLYREGQQVLDTLNRIKRFEVTVIDSLPNAQLTRIILVEPSLYVLDSANGFVYEVRLADDGLRLARPSEPINAMRTGGLASGIEVGEIIDIAYNSDPNNNSVIAVDRQGVLIECPPRFPQNCEGQRLLDAESWTDPAAVAAWEGRIYVLDPGAGEQGQIWRYRPSGGAYRNAPEEVFSGAEVARPVLRTAIDLEIDRDGNIYILLAEGVLRKYFDETPLDFTFSDFPSGEDLTTATSMFLDDTVTSQTLYVVSRPKRTIYKTSLVGLFRDSYRIFNEAYFDLLSAIVVAPAQSGRGEIVYAVSGNTIFAFEISD